MVTVNRGGEYSIVAADAAVWERATALLRAAGHRDADAAADVVTRNLNLYADQNHGRRPQGPFGIAFANDVAGCVANTTEWAEYDAENDPAHA